LNINQIFVIDFLTLLLLSLKFVLFSSHNAT
jgi:hypothetical protein